MKTKVKTFIVKRSRWLRGQGSDGSALCKADGQKCCLGFVGMQSKVRVKDMLDKPLPHQLPYDLRNLFPTLLSSTAWSTFSGINDNVFIDDKEREKRLKALAKKNGFRFKFIP